MGLSFLPEETVISLSVIGSSFFYDFQGDSPAEVSKAAAERYQEVNRDPLVGPLKSTIPYSFSKTKPKHGYYYLYEPESIEDETRILLFLHGFGGCFKYYIHFLRKAFPNDILVFPVYGHSGGIIERRYLKDMWADLGNRVAIEGGKPWLIGISAGGYSVFRLYGGQPEGFSGAVSIASVCPDNEFSSLSKQMKLLMLNGDNEQGLPKRVLEVQKRELSARIEDFEFHYIEGTHFFLFQKEEEVAKHMQNFIDSR